MSIDQIAETAGVSRSTVYKVINNKSDVSPSTAKIVQRVLKETGYVPRGYNRRKSSPKLSDCLVTGNIGVLFYDTRHNTPLTSGLLYGLERAISEDNLNMVLNQFDGQGDVPRCIARHEVDGLIVRPGDHGRLITSRLKTNIPSVWLFEKRIGHLPSNTDSILSDDVVHSHLAVEYLCDCGAKELAILNPWVGHASTQERIFSFKQSANAYGINVTVLSDGADAAGVSLVKQMLTLTPRVDGVLICGNTVEFLNYYQDFVDEGVKLGEDIHVVSTLNDHEVPRKLNINIANMDIQAEIIGQRAVEKLFWRMRNPAKPHEKVVIEPKITLYKSGS